MRKPKKSKKQNDRPHFLTGKWEVEGFYEYEYFEEGPKLEYISKHGPGYMIWEFAGDARLSAWVEGKPEYDTKYLYVEESKELLIALSYLEVFKFHDIMGIDSYRVDIVNLDEIWLYNLEDVIDEPQDYGYAHKLIRCL